MTRILLSYQPKNPFFTLIMMVNKNNYTDEPCTEPYFLAVDPQKITPNHLDFSNGLFVSEIKEQLYLHSEEPCWFGLTAKGKIAIMIDVHKSADFNRTFLDKCKRISLASFETVEETLGVDDSVDLRSESAASPGALSTTDSVTTDRPKKYERRKELKVDHLTKMKNDVKLLIVKDYLHSNLNPIEYLQKVAIKIRHLDGFNLLIGDFSKGMYFYSNKDKEKCIYELVQGEYALGPVPGLDTCTEVFECVDRAKREFLKIVNSIGGHELEEVPTDPDLLNFWIDEKKATVKEKRKQLSETSTIRSLFQICEREDKLIIDDNDMDQYLALTPTLKDLLSSMFINHPVFGTELNMLMILHDNNQFPTDDEIIKSFGKKVATFTKKKKGSLLRTSSGNIVPTRPISIETPEKPPPPMFSIDRKKYLCNLYIRKYDQELLTQVREGHFDKDDFWETIIPKRGQIEDTFYKSIMQYFYVDTNVD
ncbi:predicted protein [Naegleria gruberi]|uniref:Predicted protein n=1 Tax=Naegleria gruberi TaxID=5762 RepID=D2V4B5_NAEGR|nr:uncharacterized protein NAEGRDRAFT_63665 [Naegleria gruberi]EFC48356.1 predicted protein [Naegleria gruberi]|eukprot:XP_002681100.1 predicted protein [Naegleria gruberi strain NEG-M]